MKNNRIISSTISIACALGLAVTTSCTQTQQQGAAIGALAGGALGALTGKDSSDVVKGAAIGAAAGAGGAALKEEHDRRNHSANNVSNTYRQSQDAVKPTIERSSYPYAVTTENPGYVKSPYRPYNVVDVRGIPSGSMAKEPGTNNIFKVP